MPSSEGPQIAEVFTRLSDQLELVERTMRDQLVGGGSTPLPGLMSSLQQGHGMHVGIAIPMSQSHPQQHRKGHEVQCQRREQWQWRFGQSAQRREMEHR